VDQEEEWDAVPEGRLKGLPQEGKGEEPEEAREILILIKSIR